MSNDLTLETIPTSTTGWLAVTQSNFDKIEQYVNDLHTKTMTYYGEVVTYYGEIVVRFTY